MSEQNLVRACLRELRARGCLAFRVNSGGMVAEYKGRKRFVKFNGAAGCSDVLAILPPHGTLIACECKIGKNRLTENQAEFLAEVNAAGGIGLVVRDNCDDLWEAIRKAAP